MEKRSAPSSGLALAAAWLVVLLPLAWGVAQSLLKALPLFQGR